MPASRQCDHHRVEQRAFHKHVTRALADRGRFPAHDARQRNHPRRIRDYDILVRDVIIAVIQTEERLTRPPATDRQRPPRDPVRVEHVQRPPQIVDKEIGDIHQRADRPQPDRGQTPRQPVRRGRIPHPRDLPPQHPGTRLRRLDPPGDRAKHAAGRQRRPGRPRTQPPQPGSGQVPRNAAHPQRIPTVGRDADLHQRIVQPREGGVSLPGLGAFRQFDDAVMVLAQPQFALAHQHAGRLHAADLARLQRDAGGGNQRARRREHGRHAGAGIGRAAHHLNRRPGAQADATHAQPVRIGVLHRLDHQRGHERRQRRCRIMHRLHLQPDARQRVGDGPQSRLRIQMLAKPGQSELHAPTPSCSVAGASAENP